MGTTKKGKGDTKAQNHSALDPSIANLIQSQGTGFEGLDDMVKDNYLLLLADLSPQCETEGNNAGDFYLSSINKNLGKAIEIIVVAYKKGYVEWSNGDRDMNCSMVTRHTTEGLNALLNQQVVAPQGIGKYVYADRHNVIVENHILAVLVRKAGSTSNFDTAYFAATSTKISPLRDFFSQCRAKTASATDWPAQQKVCAVDAPVALYLQRWKWASIQDFSNKGKKFWNIGANGKINAEYLGIAPVELVTAQILPILELKPLEQYFLSGPENTQTVRNVEAWEADKKLPAPAAKGKTPQTTVAQDDDNTIGEDDIPF